MSDIAAFNKTNYFNDEINGKNKEINETESVDTETTDTETNEPETNETETTTNLFYKGVLAFGFLYQIIIEIYNNSQVYNTMKISDDLKRRFEILGESYELISGFLKTEIIEEKLTNSLEIVSGQFFIDPTRCQGIYSSGKNKGERCKAKGKYGRKCGSHCDKASKPEKNKTQNSSGITNEQPIKRCPAIIQSGTNQGKVCNAIMKNPTQENCSKHSRTKISKEEQKQKVLLEQTSFFDTSKWTPDQFKYVKLRKLYSPVYRLDGGYDVIASIEETKLSIKKYHDQLLENIRVPLNDAETVVTQYNKMEQLDYIDTQNNDDKMTHGLEVFTNRKTLIPLCYDTIDPLKKAFAAYKLKITKLPENSMSPVVAKIAYFLHKLNMGLHVDRAMTRSHELWEKDILPNIKIDENYVNYGIITDGYEEVKEQYLKKFGFRNDQIQSDSFFTGPRKNSSKSNKTLFSPLTKKSPMPIDPNIICDMMNNNPSDVNQSLFSNNSPRQNVAVKKSPSPIDTKIIIDMMHNSPTQNVVKKSPKPIDAKIIIDMMNNPTTQIDRQLVNGTSAGRRRPVVAIKKSTKPLDSNDQNIITDTTNNFSTIKNNIATVMEDTITLTENNSVPPSNKMLRTLVVPGNVYNNLLTPGEDIFLSPDNQFSKHVNKIPSSNSLVEETPLSNNTDNTPNISKEIVTIDSSFLTSLKSKFPQKQEDTHKLSLDAKNTKFASVDNNITFKEQEKVDEKVHAHAYFGAQEKVDVEVHAHAYFKEQEKVDVEVHAHSYFKEQEKVDEEVHARLTFKEENVNDVADHSTFKEQEKVKNDNIATGESCVNTENKLGQSLSNLNFFENNPQKQLEAETDATSDKKPLTRYAKFRASLGNKQPDIIEPQKKSKRDKRKKSSRNREPANQTYVTNNVISRCYPATPRYLPNDVTSKCYPDTPRYPPNDVNKTQEPVSIADQHALILASKFKFVSSDDSVKYEHPDKTGVTIIVPTYKKKYITPFPLDGSEITDPKYAGESREAIVARYRDLRNFLESYLGEPKFSRKIANDCRICLRALYDTYGESMGFANCHLHLGPVA
jgi:hypothetical protein